MSKLSVSIILMHLVACLCAEDRVEVKVILENGDVVSGYLLEESDSELVLESPYFGSITLAKDDAESVQREIQVVPDPDEIVAAVTEEAAAEGEEEQLSPEAAATELADEEEVDEEPATGILSLLAGIQEEFNPLPLWEKNLQFGVNSSSGRKDQTTINYRLDMQRSLEASRLDLKAEYAYGDANGTKTIDRLSSSLRWRKDISPGVFYESQSIYSSDVIKLIDSNLEQKLGLGTRFVESDSSTLSAGLGASGRWREFSDNEEEVAYLVDIFQDWDYRMSDRFRLTQDFKVAMPLEETDEYEVKFSAAVTSAVTESINLSIRYELGYDNSLEESLKEDRRFVSSLGYAF